MKKTIACYLMFFTLIGICTGAEWVKNGDFESGQYKPWFLTSPKSKAKLSIITDEESPIGDSSVLGITIEKEPNITVRQRLNVKPGKYKFTAYIDTTRCTKPKGYAMIYFDGNINGKWKNFGGVTTPGTPKTPGMHWQKTKWKKYEKTITVPAGGKIENIYIVLTHIDGTVMVDGISLQNCDVQAPNHNPAKLQESKAPKKDSNAVEGSFLSRKYRNLFRHDETPELGFELNNPLDCEITAEVKFTTTDYFGRHVAEMKKKITLPAKGKISEILKYPGCKLPGFYCTEAHWNTGKTAGECQASFVKVGPIPQKKDPLFGISFYYGQNRKNAERLELMAAGSAGVEFNWIWWLHKRPEDLLKFKERLEDLRKRGIEPIGGFETHHHQLTRNYWNRWFSNKNPINHNPSLKEIQPTLIPFIEKIVALYKPYIRVWFLGGEIDIHSRRNPQALPDSIEMIKFTSNAIRRMDPDAEIQGIGISGFRNQPVFPFMNKMLPDVKDYLDGLAPDIYPVGNSYGKGFKNLNTESSGFRAGLLEVVKMAKVTKKQYVSCAEGGPCIVRSTPLNDPCGVRMANIEARQFILMKTIPKMRHWQYFRPDNWNPKTTVDWGMWEKENPRQVVSAYAATARIMAFAKFVKELVLHQDIPCWIFSKDGRYFAAVWYNGMENLKAELTPGIPAEAKDVQGNPINIKDGTLLLGEAPVYLYAKDPATLERLLAKAADNVSELDFALDRQNKGKTLLVVKNKSGHGIDLNLKKVDFSNADGKDKQTILYSDKITLASGEIKSIEKSIGAEKVSFHMQTGKGRNYSIFAVLKSIPVPQVNSFDELRKKAAPQFLNDPVRQIPVYADLKVHNLYTGLNDLSAVFRLGYDKQYLYLEVQVKDDVHLNNAISSRGIFVGDCIQFAVDPLRNAKIMQMRNISGYANDDFNFASALASGKSYTHCYVSSVKKRKELLDKNYRLPPVIIRDEKTKTTLYRVKIAFEDLAPLKPEKGRNFGFSIAIFDRDPPSEYYNMAYSGGVTQPFDPAKYPAFQFE